jgi:tetratricopeptide (TPR) repeat protein
MYSLIPAFYAAERRGIDPQRLNVSEQYWHELGAGFSFLLLLGAIGLRQSLPQIASLYSDWGFKHYKHGDWGTAEEDYKRALKLNADDDQTSFRLGLLYEELQDSDKARSNYRLAARAGIPEAINNLSRLNLLDNKPALATPLLLKSLEDEKLPAETRYALLKNLGWARLLQNDYSDAESYLKDAIDLQKTAKLAEKANDPKNDTTLAIASPYCLLALVKEAQGNKKAALPAWETCNANHNPYITEETNWAVIARKKLKEQDSKK